MTLSDHHYISAECAEHHDIVEHLAEQAFGPGRFTRTAFRLREGIPHEPDLSFVCWLGDQIIASVRLTRIKVGEDDVLLLGPLVVSPDHKAQGYGAELMKKAVNSAREKGHLAIILVGDLPYYQKFGFEPVERGTITMPGPVDPARLLVCDLNLEEGHKLIGSAKPFLAMPTAV